MGTLFSISDVSKKKDIVKEQNEFFPELSANMVNFQHNHHKDLGI